MALFVENNKEEKRREGCRRRRRRDGEVLVTLTLFAPQEE